MIDKNIYFELNLWFTLNGEAGIIDNYNNTRARVDQMIINVIADPQSQIWVVTRLTHELTLCMRHAMDNLWNNPLALSMPSM